MSSTPFKKAIEAILTDLQSETVDWEKLNEKAKKINQLAKFATMPELNQALDMMAEHLDLGGTLSLLGGCFIESGAESGAFASSLFTRLSEVLALSCEFLDQVESIFPEMDEETEEEPETEGMQIGNRWVPASFLDEALEKSPAATAFFSLQSWCLPAIAVLTQNHSLRLEIRQDEELVEATERLWHLDGSTRFLNQLLTMLENETIVVLHPETDQGFRVRLNGVVDNFQLQMLLADALIGDTKSWVDRSPGATFEGLPGTPPRPEIMAVYRGDGPQQIRESSSAVWQMYEWTVITPAGTLPAELPLADHRIWGEGIPSDIEFFENERVVILTPPVYPSSWNTMRTFQHLKAGIEVVQVFTKAETRAYLQRLGAAPRQSAE